MSNHLHIWLMALKKRAQEKMGLHYGAPGLTATCNDSNINWTFVIQSSPPCYLEGPTPEDVLERAGKWIEDWQPPKPQDWLDDGFQRGIRERLPFDPRRITDIQRDGYSDTVRVCWSEHGAPCHILYPAHIWEDIGGRRIEFELAKRQMRPPSPIHDRWSI